MQTKHLFMFAAIAVLGGAIFSMATFGVFAAQANYNANAQTNGSLIDEILGEEEADDAGDDGEDAAGEVEEECIEDDSQEGIEPGATASMTDDENEVEDEDEAGDEDVNDEEDEDAAGEDGSTTAATEEDYAEGEDHDMSFDPCNFSSEIDNPYLPMSKYVGKTLTFAGNSTQDGQSMNVTEVWTVLSNTSDVADVETLTVRVQEYEDGELVREALQYYAQGKDGVVYFFGEDIVDIENGVEVENDEESWTVGDDATATSIAMPATPATGMGFGFKSVDVPGIAHELSEVKSLNETVSVGYGTFTALELTDYDFDDGKVSQEFYASGVGLIKEVDEDEELELIAIE